jgi:hypothetical protein
LTGSTYTYAPRHERADSALLAEAPENRVQEVAPGVQIERVEVQLRIGEASVWTRDADQRRRVFVLASGRQRAVVDESAAGLQPLCLSQLGEWRVVAEHALG